MRKGSKYDKHTYLNPDRKEFKTKGEVSKKDDQTRKKQTQTQAQTRKTDDVSVVAHGSLGRSVGRSVGLVCWFVVEFSGCRGFFFVFLVFFSCSVGRPCSEVGGGDRVGSDRDAAFSSIMNRFVGYMPLVLILLRAKTYRYPFLPPLLSFTEPPEKKKTGTRGTRNPNTIAVCFWLSPFWLSGACGVSSAGAGRVPPGAADDK